METRRAGMKLTGVLVRLAHEDDGPRVGELLSWCVRKMRAEGIDQWDEVYPSAATLAADLDAGTLYVASLPGLPVAGAVVLDDRQEQEYAAVPWAARPPRVGVVHRLMVHPGAQQRGLGTHLMRFVELRARRLGYGAIRLDSFTSNPRSLRLYQRLGYREAGPVTFRKGRFLCFEKDLAGEKG